jgi:hypothetical protein
MRNLATKTPAFVLAALLLTSCGGGKPTIFPHAPSTISVTGAEGTLVELEHRYGLTVTTSIRNGSAELPILWDGRWRVRAGGRVDTIQIGAIDYHGIDASPETAGERLLDCWRQADTDEPVPRATTPEGVRCSQGLLTAMAAEHGYDAAAEAISLAREGLGEDTNLWGWYCNIAGEAAAAGAVFGGADPRELMRDEESFCDYSVLHGVGAAVAVEATDPLEALEYACGTDPESPLPELARTSQCWHGGGMGIARRMGGDTMAGSGLCMRARDEPSRLNCLDGLFSFARTYLLRGTDTAALWPMLVVDFGSCAETGGSTTLVEACYRSAAQSAVRETASAVADSHDVRERVVPSMRSACHRAEEYAAPCWTGMGTLIANTLHPDIDERAEIRRWVAECGKAPDNSSAAGCYERALLGLLRNDQLVNGLLVEELVPLAPAELRDDLEEKLTYWRSTLGGRSN